MGFAGYGQQPMVVWYASASPLTHMWVAQVMVS